MTNNSLIFSFIFSLSGCAVPSGDCTQIDDDGRLVAVPNCGAPADSGDDTGTDGGLPDGGGTTDGGGTVGDGGTDGGDDTGDGGGTDGGSTKDGGSPDGGSPDGGGTTDGGTSDGGSDDTGTDGGMPDGGTSDGGLPDGGTSDGGLSDGGGTTDGGSTDGGDDTGTSDGGGTGDGGTVGDGGLPDGGGTGDGGVSDGGTSDGGSDDTGTDGGMPDGGTSDGGDTGGDDTGDGGLSDGGDTGDGGVEPTDNDLDGYFSVETGGTDCDDGDSAIHPDAPELCDGIDNDCEGGVDEDLEFVSYYVDGDGDGFGDEADVGSSECVDPGAGYALVAGDCNDGDSTVHPGAAEIEGDSIDQDCDDLDTFFAEDFGIGSGACTLGEFVRSDGGSIHQTGACEILIQEGGTTTEPSVSVDVTLTGLVVGVVYTAEWAVENQYSTSVTIVADLDGGDADAVTLATGEASTLQVTWTADSTSATARIWTTGSSYYDGVLSGFVVTTPE